MISSGLFSQIGMIAISVGIILTYIKPTLSNISTIQDDIYLYQTKFESVEAVNNKLASLVSRLESASSEDKNRLTTFMPDSIDRIDIPRDLYIIAKEAGLYYVDSKYLSTEQKNKGTSKVDDEHVPNGHLVQLSVEGTYAQIKYLFFLLERNDYLLELDNLSITKLDGGFLEASVTLKTYSYKASDTAKQILF